jgi:glycylpeptide N-tetradecanoyltransferase
LPTEVSLPAGYTIRKSYKKDAKQLRDLINGYLSKFEIKAHFTKKEVEHWFTHRDEIIECFVVVNKENKITDLFSFYNLPSSILGHKKYTELKAAYAYYLIPGDLPMIELVRGCMITAKSKGYDVFNMLDIMDNQQVFEDLLFCRGDGFLQYYFYNWVHSKKVLHPKEIGIVLM